MQIGIVQKLEGCNPYDVIKQDDYILYEKLKGCLPYSFKSYRQLKELLVSSQKLAHN